MKYTINLIIVFDPKHRTLTLNNNSQTAIELSNRSCRVLNEFIKNYRIDLSRDALLKNVWEDYGLPPSNASLNNCISELRKAFVNLGIETSIIITLPKIGFKMEASVHPTPEQKTNAKTKGEEEPNFIEEIPTGNFPIVVANRPQKKLMLLYLLALLGVFGIIGTTLLFWMPSTQVKLIGIYKECNIYSIDNETPIDAELKAKQIIESKKLNCNQTSQDIFYTEERPDNDLFKITFLAACKKKEIGNSYQHCKTFKVVE
jgi:DNA-binding winged helix-turn-helix (wHTH) protein